MLGEVVDQTTTTRLHEKICDKYKQNSLMNQQYQKKHLYTLQMDENTQEKDHMDSLFS